MKSSYTRVSAHMSHIRIRNGCVTYAFNCTHVRKSFICVWVPHVEFNTCANNTNFSHRIKLQRKIDTVGFCRPGVATDQDLHSLSFILSHFSLTGVKPDITITCLYNFDPIKPHFYKVKLAFIGVYIVFLITAQKHRLWVLVRTASARRF